MELWGQWWWCVQALRPACARWRTFVGMVLVLVGLSVRSDLAQDTAAFVTAASPVYGETEVELAYCGIDLLWRPIGRMARFVIVLHPTRGTLFLLSSDTTLSPLEIIALYGYRFKIEVALRHSLLEFLAGTPDDHKLKKILLEHMDPDQVPQLHMVA